MYMIIMFCILIMMLNFIKNSKNVLLFLLNLELSLIFTAFFYSFMIKINFMIILMLGVLEAVVGLTFLIIYIRFFGNDYMNLI